MAERALPAGDDDPIPTTSPKHPEFIPPQPPPPNPQKLILSNSNSSTATFRSGTYIVRVPKDQIYRMPPPEHATIVERHRGSGVNKKSCSYCCLGIIAFIILFIITLVAVILTMLAKSGDPKFSVERVVVKGKLGRPDYNVTLEARNPNSRVAIVYKDGGGASLYFKQKKIANGKYPSLYQGSGKSKEVALVLHGSNMKLPKEIEKSLESSHSSTYKKGHRVSLSLNMDIPARMRIGTLNSRSRKFHVTCDITVDTLAKGTKVLKQECQTERK
ncbi:NDR1/HIN1-like protein 13 [Prunus avium]|uniref:NDR1/HIN1-like protein 13 n=1 Tax=Prunus avium TaxID=42229 RepID=A0A6P5SK04_PRUAV|nr:NDR1/HIN1-like protein 13 [Prunus avium]